MNQIIERVFTKKVAAFFAATFLVIFAALTIAAPQKDNIAAAFPRDCDDNAIIYCGADKNELANKYNALDGVGKSAFSHAGVEPSKFGQVVHGQVTNDNRVIVNGETVATNVNTYGRHDMPGSTQIPGGAYMRHPSVSFSSSSLDAWVLMDGKEFKWAVIAACGNPVQGPPTHKNNPKISIVKKANKQVVKPNETFNYTITVKNIGNVVLTNVVIADILPAGLEPVGLNEGVTYNKNTRKITWPAFRLPVNASVNKVFKVKVDANAKGFKKNIACVTTNYNPDLPLCDDVTVRIPPEKPEEPEEPEEPEVPETPEEPEVPEEEVVEELPDTGAGAVFGIFTATSGIAGAAHYVIKRKFLV